MERWFILSNCHTFGLANSFRFLNRSLEVEAADIWMFKADPLRFQGEMAACDRIVIHPDLADALPAAAEPLPMVNYLPSIDFGAYHPDIGFFTVDGVYLSGPMTAYHSIIAVAAYNEGLSIADTLKLYNGRMYEACGYSTDWVPQRDALLGRFRDHGVDLAGSFPRWGRERSFMYSNNHPRIEAVHEIARLFLDALGLPTTSTGLLPSDNLVHGACLPVYTEIGEMLGVHGSYLFKTNAEYRYLSLEEFIVGSFATYAASPRHGITPDPAYSQRYDRVTAIIQGAA